jgi:beta-lactamase class D
MFYIAKISRLLVLSLVSLLVFSTVVQADCFIIKELRATSAAISEGECQERVSPGSTFEIALALMGFESGILKDPKTPEWPFKPEYESSYGTYIDKWRAPHAPASWIKDSCIWYSQALTQTLGLEKFRYYVELFNYGNQDISGNIGQNNGLTNAWLNSSLKISPSEQIQFITNILLDKIPISTNAVELTKQLLFTSNINKKWKLYANANFNDQLTHSELQSKDLQIGWYVGWVSNLAEDKHYMFAYLLQDNEPKKITASLKAKKLAETKIKAFLKTQNR